MLEKKIGFTLYKKNILVNFHPVTIRKNMTRIYINEILEALKIFSKHPRTKSEIEARLEQLRAFDLEMKIIIEEAVIPPGPDVDTEEDLHKVRRILGTN